MQATYLSDLYDDFLFSVKDYSFMSLTDEEIKEDLDYYFRKARAKFHKCKNKLSLLKDEEGIEYFGYIQNIKIKPKDMIELEDEIKLEDEDILEDVVSPKIIVESVNEYVTEEVGVELTDFEKNILTHLMLVEYLKPHVMTGEFLKPAMSDKGFKIHSQANHLRELSLLYRTVQRESKKMITEYTYLELGEERND